MPVSITLYAVLRFHPNPSSTGESSSSTTNDSALISISERAPPVNVPCSLLSTRVSNIGFIQFKLSFASSRISTSTRRPSNYIVLIVQNHLETLQRNEVSVSLVNTIQTAPLV